jgi:allene oxide cyclase
LSRRFLLGVSISGAMALLLATVIGASVSGASSTFTVVERATTDVVIDVGAPGDSIGDSLAFGNQVFNAANTKKVGRDQGSCVRTKVGMAWECSWTTFLKDGQIVVQGPFFDDGSDSTLAITGGTGSYAGARGEMVLHFRNDLGTEFDFTFHLR